MTRPVVLYPDAVQVVVDYLAAQLTASGRTEATGATVHSREPDPFPTTAPVIVVRRSGGRDDGYVVDKPRVDVIVWHTDEGLANDLANLCRAYLLAAAGVRSGVTVTSVNTFAGPVSAWDEDRDLPRVLLTVEVGVRGSGL